MSYYKTEQGETVHFPASYSVNDAGVIPAPAPAALVAMAAEVRPDHLFRLSLSLVKAAKRRRHEDRYSAVNQARLHLAQLCLQRLAGEAEGRGSLITQGGNHEACE